MKLALGTVQFGLDYGINSTGKPSDNNVREILNQAYKHNIDTLDTSAAYGDSEIVLGKTMGQNHFKIVSKYPQCPIPVEQKLNQSLDNLGRKSIYGYLIHHFETYQQNPQIWKEFQNAKKQRKVQKIGFSIYTPQELEIILNRGDNFDLIQFPYNIFDRQFEPYMRELKNRGVEIHVRSTFLQGLFFMDPNQLPPKLQPLKPHLEELNDYAKQNHLTISQVALNFNLQNQQIDRVLIGVDNPEQLNENINSITQSKIDLTVDIAQKHLLNPTNWK